MKPILYKQTLQYLLLVGCLLIFYSCKSNQKNEKIGFLGFYLDMDYGKVKGTMDSLLDKNDLRYYETTNVLGTRQKDLYYNLSEISPVLYAKVNLRGTYIIDQRLTSIQLTLCTKLKNGDTAFSFNCKLEDLNKAFQFYKDKYGSPEKLGKGEKYDWLSKKISDIYTTGPKGRLIMDKIYFWEKGNYIVFFDFGYPVTEGQLSPSEKSDIQQPDSTSAPIIYYSFTEDYIDKLMDEESRNKTSEKK